MEEIDPRGSWHWSNYKATAANSGQRICTRQFHSQLSTPGYEFNPRWFLEACFILISLFSSSTPSIKHFIHTKPRTLKWQLKMWYVMSQEFGDGHEINLIYPQQLHVIYSLWILLHRATAYTCNVAHILGWHDFHERFMFFFLFVVWANESGIFTYFTCKKFTCIANTMIPHAFIYIVMWLRGNFSQ